MAPCLLNEGRHGIALETRWLEVARTREKSLVRSTLTTFGACGATRLLLSSRLISPVDFSNSNARLNAWGGRGTARVIVQLPERGDAVPRLSWSRRQ